MNTFNKKNYYNNCLVRGCSFPVYVKKHGLCQGHYNRICRTGDVGDSKIRVKRKINSAVILNQSAV